MSSYTDIFGGGVVNTANTSYIEITLSGNITLSWPTDFQNVNTNVYDIMDVDTTADSFVVTMPSAQTTSVGQTVLFNNISGNSFSVNNFSGSLLVSIDLGQSWFLYLTDNSTPGGLWRTIPYAGGGPSVTSVAATSSSDNLTITGSPITTTGTFTFNFANDLAQLSGFGNGTGIACRTAANTWALRNVVGTANQITVTNPGGVAGNITISLPSTVSGINSLTVGNLVLSANTITTNNAGGIAFTDNISLAANDSLKFFAANGTNFNTFASGSQTFNQNYAWPTTAAGDGQVLQFTTGGLLSWATIPTFTGSSTTHAIARYLNTTGSLEDSSVLLNDTNDITGVNSITIQNLQIGIPDGQTISSSSSSINIIPSGSSPIKLGNPNSATNLNNVWIQNGAQLVMFEPFASGTNSTSISQPPLSTNILYQLPIIGPGVGDTLRMAGSGPTLMQWDDSIYNPNLLINGSMAVWQAGTSFTSSTVFFPNSNNTMMADCWKLQSDGNNVVNVTQDVGPGLLDASCRYSMLFTVVTPNKKFGIVEILENKDSSNLKGFYSTLSFAGKASGITNVRMALIQWNGTSDAPTSNIVSAWNASGTNPSLAAGWTYVAQVSGTIVNNAMTSSFVIYSNSPTGLTYNSIPSAGTNNLAVFIWVDDTTIAANATLNLSAIKLEEGFYTTRFIAPIFEAELQQSKRQFNKDLPYAQAVGTVFPATPTTPITAASNCYHLVTSPVLNGAAYANIEFDVEMRTTPTTFATYPYTTVANTGRWSDNTGTDFVGASSASTFALDSKGAIIYNNLAAAGTLTTSNNIIIGHWYAYAGF